MRFRTRVFLLCFLPFCVLLGGSFWAIEGLAQKTIRNGLRITLRENQRAMSRMHARGQLAATRYLKIAGENSSLKAGIQLCLSYPGSALARATLQDQLQDLGVAMGFDFMMASDARNAALSAVVRNAGGNVTAYEGPLPQSLEDGFVIIADRVYQLTTVPLDQGDENLGSLSVGQLYSLDEFSTPVVLLKNSQAVESSIPEVSLTRVSRALGACASKPECDVRIGGANYLSMALGEISPANGFELRSLQNVDTAGAQTRAVLRDVFLLAGLGGAIITLILSVVTSRSIVRPVMKVVSHLRNSEQTGTLTEFPHQLSSILEVRELTSTFNRAAASIRDARETLQRAYVEFMGSLASALDARDPYTAGHSQRVSRLASATAAAMGASPELVEITRVGALLHDIGKIGISDLVLQKPGKLTKEEFSRIKEHPEIGRRILEGVNGFTAHLGAVEFHHENWDGTGYPRGQQGEETPFPARVIHIADAYDAMTSDRPYRRGMSGEQAVAIILRNAGGQFDPAIARAFAALQRQKSAHPAEFAELECV